MTEPLQRLADDVFVAPRIAGWPAWWGNVAPLPAAFIVPHQQIRLMRSYLRDPALHLRAASMNATGTAYLRIPADRAAEVAEVAELAEREYAGSIALAADAAAFAMMLTTEARGQSLAPFYAMLPASLRGFTELVYDYHGRASVRLDEGVLYHSAHYKPALQQLSFHRLAHDTDRDFFLSGLGLPGDDVTWTVPFDDARVQGLFSLDVAPRPLSWIRERLGSAWREELGAFFVEAGPVAAAPPPATGLRIRYVGHACVLVEHAGRSLIVDPFVSSRPSAKGAAPRTTFADLPARIDVAAITHAHPDHFDIETLLRLLPRIGELVVPRNHGLLAGDISLAMLARRLGYRNVREVGSLEGVPFGDGELLALPFLGEHGDVAHGNKAAWLVRGAGHQILFAADSAAHDLELYRRLRTSLGVIDTVFMNTEATGSPLSWTYEALFPRMRDRRIEADRRCRGSNAEEGAALAQAVGATRVFNYALGLEPWVSRILGRSSGPSDESNLLLEKVKEQGKAIATRLEGSTTIDLG